MCRWFSQVLLLISSLLQTTPSDDIAKVKPNDHPGFPTAPPAGSPPKESKGIDGNKNLW